MSRREADRFEEALQMEARGRAVDERLASLVEVARRASVLAAHPPPPPHRLAPGRQRFLAEAARLRNPSTNRRKVRIRMATIPSTVLTALMLVFGLLFSAGQVTAASLPGDPLYGIKLMAEEVRMASVAAPVSKAELTRARAEQRMDEVALLLQAGEVVNEATSLRAQEHLRAALQTAAQLHTQQATRALQRLEEGIQLRQRIMGPLADEGPDTPVQRLLREMERVRLHACDGQENLDRLRERLRLPDGQETLDRLRERLRLPDGQENLDRLRERLRLRDDQEDPDRLQERLRLRDGPSAPEDDGERGVPPAPGDSNAGGQPDPDPAPAPGGNGNAEPNPDPAPAPGGKGNSDPQPDPAPDPGPDPDPEPAPEPGGNGNAEPSPDPSPDPGCCGEPDPNPDPAPGPGGNGGGEPDPDPSPGSGGGGGGGGGKP
jgi:hypothetical protein